MKRVLRDVVVGAVSCVATVGAGASAVLATAAPALAQTGTSGAPAAQPAAQPSGVAIRRILVEGNQRIEPSTITSYMLVRPGDTFDPARIDLSLKTLFATGLFADVQIEQRDGDLVVSVIENPIVNRVIFEGLNALGEDDLGEEVQAKPRSVFTPARAQADVQRIIELYRRSGRFAATVTPQVRELDQNRVDLIFEIDEGPVTGVRNINFIGNEEFSDRTLSDVIVTTRSRWWNFFSKNDNYDPDRLEYDREQLRQYYNNRGFADFRVVSAVAELTPDQRDFYITFTVDEGPKYEFGEITVGTALDRLPADMLKAVIPIRQGEVFQGELIEDSIDAMTYVAGTVGYANVNIRPVVERDLQNRVVNIRFEVNEGPRVFIERIDIVGNTRTIDRVIRREMRVNEGDAFNRVLLDRSRARIRSLGFFGDVTIEETPGSQPDRSVVTVTVEEESTGELAFAAGFSSTENFLFDVSVSERNLRGRGQFLRLRASTSSQRQQVDLRFTEPRFMGREMAAGFDIYSLRTDYRDQSSFENQSTGIGLRTSFPLTERTSLGLTYSLIHDDTQIDEFDVFANGVDASGGIVDRCDPSYIYQSRLCDQEGTFLTSMLGYTFNWDQKNDPINPTRGFDLSVSQDFAGLGGDLNYLRSELEGGVYYGLFRGVTASFRGSAGYIFGWGGDDIRINDRFFKGGSSFRGFDVAGLGPRELVVDNAGNMVDRGDSVGGNLYAIGTIQLSLPLGLPESFGLSGALFTDFGTLGVVDRASKEEVVLPGGLTRRIVEDETSLRASAGVSVYWDSPFGPVQFDFAQSLAHEEYDRRESFRFSTRTRF